MRPYLSVSKRKKKPKPAARPARAHNAHGRQRQRLIDASISALHTFGPSRTTVAKVVAIAKMSPGIVRFYFDSKAAMLVASLQFLAAEFEEQVMIPVAKLKSRPVAALQLMVDLYLDPEIASPRKVSVWYAFWGEASSRQEYYDICGQKDESFAALVRELIGRLIAETSQPHLDSDGVALGLIGALEILWQDIAFQTERDIDRPAAKRRCMAYLRSVFPGQFAVAGAADTPATGGAAGTRFAAWAYDNGRALALERDSVFRGAWTAVGHESQIARAGDFLTADIGVERVLVVRGRAGEVHAVRNSCPEVPHTLVTERAGRFEASIECKIHGLQFTFGGHHGVGRAQADLGALEARSVRGLLFVRAPLLAAPGPAAPDFAVGPGFATEPPEGLTPPQGLMLLGAPLEVAVGADWKVVVEQWLESAATGLAPAGADSFAWNVAMSGAEWSCGRYLHLMDCAVDPAWRRQFVMPNQLFETRPDGVSVVQVLPTAPGHSLLRRLDYTVLPPDDAARAVLYLARRLGPYARRATVCTVESIQRGLVEFGYEAARGLPTPAAVAWFRRRLAARIPALAREQPPGV